MNNKDRTLILESVFFTGCVALTIAFKEPAIMFLWIMIHIF